MIHEPSGIEIVEKIREVVLHLTHTVMHKRTDMLLYAVACTQHFYEKVAPVLAMGKHTRCDRFINWSFAYQVYVREIGVAEVFRINKFAIGQKLPDVRIYFDVASEIGLVFHQKVQES